MLNWMDLKSAIAGAVAAVIAGGALIPAFALAQTPDATPEATPSATDDAAAEDCGPGMRFGFELGGEGLRGFGFGLREDAAEEVAAALGVTVDDLQQAVRTVIEGMMPDTPSLTPPTDEEREARKAEFQAALAEELGVSVDDLTAAIEAAQPTEEELAAAKAEARTRLEEYLAAAVEAGRITQEEADAALAAFDAGERPLFPGFEGPGGRGLRGGGRFGGFHLPFGDGTDDGGSTTTSSDAA